jgi:signal transduction histidine kinase
VLDLERLRAGRLSLDLQPRPIAEVVARAIAETRAEADQAGVAVGPGMLDLDGLVLADGGRLVQVLVKLLSNAIKFSPRGGLVTLAVECDSEHVRFSVTDQGPGIPADQLEAIFERFRQVDASDSRLKSGPGLGLAVCRGIVRLHSGRLWAESQLGRGSTFYIELAAAG